MLRMVLSIAESASAQLRNTQFDFCKAQDVIACTKASIASAKKEARFDSVWSGILSATEANDVV